MQIINNLGKAKRTLEVGDIICFQLYGEVQYRLVCKVKYNEYHSVDLENGAVKLKKDSLAALWEDYSKYDDVHFIKSNRIKLVIE